MDIRARIATSQAFLDYETGAPEAAFAEIDRALTLPGLSAETRGIVQCQRAMLLLRRGETAQALEAFGEGIGGLTDPVELGKAHINRGGVHLAQGRPWQAASDFERARELWTKAGRLDEAGMATHNLGYARYLSGDLVQALNHMDASTPRLSELSPVMAATVAQDRAEVLLAAGLVTEGRQALVAAARAFGRRRMAQRRAEAELAIARTLVESDPALGRATARVAARRFRRVGATAWAARADALAFAAATRLGGKGAALLREAEGVATKLDDQGLRWPARSVRLHAATMLLHNGDPGGARRLVGSPRARNDAPLSVRLLEREVRADLSATLGRRVDAMAHLRRGLVDLHEWQSSFGSLDLQTNVVGQGARLAVRGLALAVESRRPPVLFEWSERARMLASRIQPVRAPRDEQLVADLAELRSGPTPARESELRKRIRERAWQLDGSGQVVDPVTLPELQKALDDTTALAAYVVTADRVTALVVTDSGTAWRDLGGRDKLDRILGGLLPDLDVASSDVLPEALRTAVRGELVGRLALLADLLVAPLLDDLGDRAVVLTPSGVLAGVPWTLLPGFVGRPVTVAQSATSWLARTSTPLRTATAGLVAGPRVMRAEAEVGAVAKEWAHARVLVGAEATAEAVSELAASVDVLHVAAHGRHSAESPLFSGLQLADGPWFGYDIDQLAAVPDVVLLSACEVGRSTVRWGEELIGMTAAWLHAGARCVVASPAAVADEAAYDVLVRLHRGLASGVAPAEALAAAVPAATAGDAPAPFLCFS